MTLIHEQCTRTMAGYSWRSAHTSQVLLCIIPFRLTLFFTSRKCPYVKGHLYFDLAGHYALSKGLVPSARTLSLLQSSSSLCEARSLPQSSFEAPSQTSPATLQPPILLHSYSTLLCSFWYFSFLIYPSSIFSLGCVLVSISTIQQCGNSSELFSLDFHSVRCLSPPRSVALTVE
jgi:hypothetical protein